MTSDISTPPRGDRDRNRFGRRSRGWMGGMGFRVALILLFSLAIIELITHVVLRSGEREEAMLSLQQAVAAQMKEIVTLWENESVERGSLLRAVNSPVFRVAHSQSVPEFGVLPKYISREIKIYEAKVLGDLTGRDISYGFANTHHHKELADLIIKDDGSTVSDRYWIVITIGVTDGTLVFAMADTDMWDVDDGPGFWGFFTWALIIMGVFWAAHRMTRPLRQFAHAADRLGMDVHAPPLPEKGSRELRRATRAFNLMQERIRRFIDDRTQMFAAISHDLRTSLTRLRLRSEFIEDEEQKSKALADLDEMEQMLSETLAFARDDSKTEATTRFDLGQLLQSLGDDLADMGHTASYEGPVHAIFEGRPVALRRAFSNLANNAIAYGNEVTIALKSSDEGFLVEFCDRGPGIPENQRERVFAPFFRLETSRNRETGGTGLGLSVSRNIARQHGGDVVLADRDGGGLIVRVVLPMISGSKGS